MLEFRVKPAVADDLRQTSLLVISKFMAFPEGAFGEHHLLAAVLSIAHDGLAASIDPFEITCVRRLAE
ncbi:hypothetical protein ASG39_18410 [Rhizobium sp. Leaf371]|nr:hypothetical protein ASG39_18410 [Rhizobium sp. Leaf371]